MGVVVSDEYSARWLINCNFSYQIIRAEVAPRFIYAGKARAFFITVHVL